VNRAARRSCAAPIGSRCLLSLVAAAGIALQAGSPHAANLRAQEAAPKDRPRVLLLVDSPGDRFMDRIRSEVVSLGMEAVMRPAQGPIEARARAEHAVAAIRILAARNGVEVWMADATSGRSFLRQVIADETPGGPNHDVVALQTAELLRTGLFHEPPPAAAGPSSSPPVIAQTAPPPSSGETGESGLRSGVELLYSAGGASPAWQAWFSFQHLWSRHLGIAFDVSAPFRRGTMSGPEGTARRRRGHHRGRGARALLVAAGPRVPHHGSGGRVGVAVDQGTSEPGSEQPDREQRFHRLHRPSATRGSTSA
jgi:hypothetical protein